jgi:septum formation protein
MLESAAIEDNLTQKQALILASNSPRRRELLGLAEWPFEVRPADVDESVLADEDPKDYVLRVAAEKARVIGEQVSDGLVLAADTTVVLDGEILGKPHNAERAREMLSALRGREHWVYSGLSILNASTGETNSDLAASRVPMRNYSDEEMDNYIESGDPLDKAGAYGIQHREFRAVEGMQECFANVMGFPLCHLTRNLRKWGISLDVNMPAACQAHLDYDCPIFEEVLKWEH